MGPTSSCFRNLCGLGNNARDHFLLSGAREAQLGDLVVLSASWILFNGRDRSEEGLERQVAAAEDDLDDVNCWVCYEHRLLAVLPQKLLGKGSHGCVYKAVLRGRHVAVKKPSKGFEIGQEVDNEIEILSKIHSPRLVNLLGFAYDTKDRLLVVELMSNGTLNDILHSNSRPPNWGRRIRMALQIANAIDTLHSQNPPIIHRDIKSANVLIDRNFNARLGDFGLALRCGVDDDYRLNFGILFLEIISGRKAIDVGHSPPSIVDWAIPLIKKGKLAAIYDPRTFPLKDPMIRKQLALIASKCVRSCRERRPAMKETMGRPVELRNTRFGSRPQGDGEENLNEIDGKMGRKSMMDTRRAYSDLGFRSNLMELMAGTDAENDGVESSLKSANRFSSSRFVSPRYAMEGRAQSHVHGKRKGLFQARKNQSVGGGSELFPTRDNAVARSSFSGQGCYGI
ncbi:hypothetical protein NC651_021516 [Populus alba x Populus x berolinensis]|nr:hypothetical protein NC651_021516 [Populus alba x Populus x berolinensis]